MLLLRLRLPLPLLPGMGGGEVYVCGVPECTSRVDWEGCFDRGSDGTLIPVRSTRLVLGAILKTEFSTSLRGCISMGNEAGIPPVVAGRRRGILGSAVTVSPGTT